MHKFLETDRVGFRVFGVSGSHPGPFDSVSTSPWVELVKERAVRLLL